MATVNSCELLNYYLVLSFLLMYSESGLSTDFIPNKTNINTKKEMNRLQETPESRDGGSDSMGAVHRNFF